MKRGFSVLGNGTKNHMCIVDAKKSRGTDGARVEALGDIVSLTINKNSLPGGSNALVPDGLRLGTPAMTARGCGV
jgi:glycine hydroxymethyltransferase